MRVAIAGATGFVGSHLLPYLKQHDLDVLALPRCIEDMDLTGFDVVINLVGRAHVLNEMKGDEIKYLQANCEYALDLFDKASAFNISLFIQVSSIGVLGSHTGSQPFSHSSPLAPADSYSKSKADAEQALNKRSLISHTRLCIIRPPLIYGRGAKGNVGALWKIASKKISFLPLGAIRNKRDFVSILNFCDFVLACIKHSDLSGGEIFLVSDDSTISSVELLQEFAKSNGNKVIAFQVPIFLLKFLFFMLGKLHRFEKFSSDLRLDISYSKNTLKWRPAFSLQETIRLPFNYRADD